MPEIIEWNFKLSINKSDYNFTYRCLSINPDVNHMECCSFDEAWFYHWLWKCSNQKAIESLLIHCEFILRYVLQTIDCYAFPTEYMVEWFEIEQ